MSDVIITVESLGKRYRLGTSRSNERYTALRDVITEKARSIFRNSKSAIRNDSEAAASEFWALKDVSFEVRQGEVLGIIGRNGAGKSTLLKILSRITEPTEGRVRIKGRVASLLEVGTGFHPELTGRENIYLNGAILGMHRTEIKAKFDEIVAFSEVEKFLDTPVKRYSSGMYVRLAFAVAAHLEPEILIVDEVLAVGDADFQKKCLGKMESVSKREGRTVLFVTHNMGIVLSLCQSGLHLNQGRANFYDDMRSAVDAYTADSKRAKEFVSSVPLDATKPSITSARILAEPTENLSMLRLEVGIFSPTAQKVGLDLLLKDFLGNRIAFGSIGSFDVKDLLQLERGHQTTVVEVDCSALANGAYTLRGDLVKPFVERYCLVEDMIAFEIHRSETTLGRRELNQNWRFGAFRLHLSICPELQKV